MRRSLALFACPIALSALAGGVLLATQTGDAPAVRPPAAPTVGAPVVTPVSRPLTVTPPPPAPGPETPRPPAAATTPQVPKSAPSSTMAAKLARMEPLPRQMYLSGRAGAEWLARMNTVKGRFDHGWVPALNQPLEGDHVLRQAGAAFALARAAHYFGEDELTARATHAILSLLEDTTLDKQTQVRRPSMPVTNSLGLSSLLVLAIHELPAPSEPLRTQAEELCNFIRTHLQGDGSVRYAEVIHGNSVSDPDGVNHYPGLALYALTRSQQHNPQSWKIDAIRKALPYYLKWWREHRDRDFVTWQTAAFAEAFLQTKDKGFADAVFEMNDWLCTLQHDRLDPRRPRALGGFQHHADGKATEGAPDVLSGSCAISLAEACRVTRQVADVARNERYETALQRCLQFLTTLQYTESDTQHFADWARPRMLGGFHFSHQNGDLRIDYNQYSVCALVQYLRHVARVP